MLSLVISLFQREKEYRQKKRQIVHAILKKRRWEAEAMTTTAWNRVTSHRRILLARAEACNATDVIELLRHTPFIMTTEQSSHIPYALPRESHHVAFHTPNIRRSFIYCYSGLGSKSRSLRVYATSQNRRFYTPSSCRGENETPRTRRPVELWCWLWQSCCRFKMNFRKVFKRLMR